MRLAKFLAHAGVASRRAAEAIVADGRVTVAGAVVTDPAQDVTGDEPVAVDGQTVRIAARRVVWAVNKPRGVVSTAKDTHGRRTVVDLVPDAGVRLYPVGRLDADTTGLLLLTDDGDLANHLTHPRYGVAKTYVAEVSGGFVAPAALRRLREGVELDDGRTAPAGVRQLRPGVLELTLREGRKRQVRRMCEAVGHPVTALRRVALGPLRLGELAEGRARRLSAAEVERLRAASGEASAAPTADAPRRRSGDKPPGRGADKPRGRGTDTPAGRGADKPRGKRPDPHRGGRDDARRGRRGRGDAGR